MPFTSSAISFATESRDSVFSSSAAVLVMTGAIGSRCSARSSSEINTASTTARVFEMTMAEEGHTVIVAWSNCARLSNDTYVNIVRTPCLPWKNQWVSKETIQIETTGSYAEAIDSMGNKLPVSVENGMISIEVNGSPCFIKVYNSEE